MAPLFLVHHGGGRAVLAIAAFYINVVRLSGSRMLIPHLLGGHDLAKGHFLYTSQGIIKYNKIIPIQG